MNSGSGGCRSLQIIASVKNWKFPTANNEDALPPTENGKPKGDRVFDFRLRVPFEGIFSKSRVNWREVRQIRGPFRFPESGN